MTHQQQVGILGSKVRDLSTELTSCFYHSPSRYGLPGLIDVLSLGVNTWFLFYGLMGVMALD